MDDEVRDFDAEEVDEETRELTTTTEETHQRQHRQSPPQLKRKRRARVLLYQAAQNAIEVAPQAAGLFFASERSVSRPRHL